MLKQQAHDGVVAMAAREHHGRLAGAVAMVRCGAVLEEDPRAAFVPHGARLHERGDPNAICLVHSGAMAQEQLGTQVVAADARILESGQAHLVLGVHVGTGSQQPLRLCGVATEAGFAHRLRRARQVVLVDACPQVEEVDTPVSSGPHASLVSLLQCLEELLVAARLVGVRLERELPVRCLDLGVGGTTANAQEVVVRLHRAAFVDEREVSNWPDRRRDETGVGLPYSLGWAITRVIPSGRV